MNKRKMNTTELEDKMRARLEKDFFMKYNHIELVSWERDHAVFKLTIQEESRNAFGMVHGGAIYSLADCATSFAAHTDGRDYVTQNAVLSYINNQSDGILFADARIQHRGGTTCLIGVDIAGEDRKLIATGTFTHFCVDKDRIMKKCNDKN